MSPHYFFPGLQTIPPSHSGHAGGCSLPPVVHSGDACPWDYISHESLLASSHWFHPLSNREQAGSLISEALFLPLTPLIAERWETSGGRKHWQLLFLSPAVAAYLSGRRGGFAERTTGGRGDTGLQLHPPGLYMQVLWSFLSSEHRGGGPAIAHITAVLFLCEPPCCLC